MNQAATKFDPVEFDKLWSSISPGGGIGPGTLFYQAEQNGWLDPRGQAGNSQDAKDILNARLFSQANRGRLLFIHETGNVLRFTTAGWVRAPIGAAEIAARNVVASIASQAAELLKQDHDSSRAGVLLVHVKYSSTLQRIQAMIELAKSEPGMSVRLSDFDADPGLLGVQNGILDLSRGRLQPVLPSTLVANHSSLNHTMKYIDVRDDQLAAAVELA